MARRASGTVRGTGRSARTPRVVVRSGLPGACEPAALDSGERPHRALRDRITMPSDTISVTSGRGPANVDTGRGIGVEEASRHATARASRRNDSRARSWPIHTRSLRFVGHDLDFHAHVHKQKMHAEWPPALSKHLPSLSGIAAQSRAPVTRPSDSVSCRNHLSVARRRTSVSAISARTLLLRYLQSRAHRSCGSSVPESGSIGMLRAWTHPWHHTARTENDQCARAPTSSSVPQALQSPLNFSGISLRSSGSSGDRVSTGCGLDGGETAGGWRFLPFAVLMLSGLTFDWWSDSQARPAQAMRLVQCTCVGMVGDMAVGALQRIDERECDPLAKLLRSRGECRRTWSQCSSCLHAAPVNQVSTHRSGTRWNSERLCVISGTSRARAWAAIQRSLGPIGWPIERK